MKAVILIGGEGTRLRPLTLKIPKAMVPILNKPFLVHLLEYLRSHGVDEVILALGYMPDPIQSHLGDGEALGVKLVYSVEDQPLGTAGAVKLAEAHLDETFLVFNGDIITEIDLTEMIKRHRKAQPRASIALTPVEDPTAFGVVETYSSGMVHRFVEKPSKDEVTTNMINAGIYVLEPEVLNDVPAGEKCMFENWVFPRLLERGEKMLSYPSHAYWIDIGTPEKYLRANHDLLREWGEEVRFQGRSEVHPSARIKGPALIGENCVIEENARIIGPAVLGSGCRVNREAAIEGAVLWEDVRVGDGAVLRNCIIGSGAQVGVGAHVSENCVIGDSALLGEGGKLPENTRVDPGSSVEPG